MTNEDTDLIVDWRNKDEVRKRFVYQKMFTRQTHENWISTMVDTGKVVQMIICEKETNRPLGSVYLRDIDYENKKAEYGIFIGEDDARGKGIGTKAAKQMIAYAFEELHLHKLFLRVFADNVRAVKSYEHAGFVEEAFLKDEVFIDGEYRDMIWMAIINE